VAEAGSDTHKGMTIEHLKNKHFGCAAFCLGTAPHLNKLDLSLLKDEVTIACNQLVHEADAYDFDYICFQRDERFRPLREDLAKTSRSMFVLPEDVLNRNHDWQAPESVKKRLVTVHSRFTSPGHAEFFSFDLTHCAYAGNVIALEVQLAAWMGCNPIYIMGVDAHVDDSKAPFYENPPGQEMDLKAAKTHDFPNMSEWLRKTRTFLWARGIRMFNASGAHSTLDVLPKMRLEAATGHPTVAVTSKTFCQDEYLVRELRRYFPDVRLNPSKGKLAGDDLVDFLKDADGMILGTEPFDAHVIEKLPCMRFVAKYGVGLNNIDFEAAKQNQIEVVYRKGVNSDSVGELVLALTLMMLRRVDDSIQSYRTGKWAKLPGRELAEMTVGIIGYGHVGKVVAEKFGKLGIGRLLVNDLLDFPMEPPAEFVPLDFLLKESDIVSIHVSMEDQNYHMVNEDFLAKMKPGARLINTSRGEVINEKSLAAVLRDGRLSGAALDVYEHEPEINQELVACPTFLPTCHMAGSSNRAIKNMGWAAIEGILKLFNKEPI